MLKGTRTWMASSQKLMLKMGNTTQTVVTRLWSRWMKTLAKVLDEIGQC